ncbi:hypothetical protein HY090_01225 [Candidatus Kaiserbacteria bacterium]|nr:hypothetical protein [Candidatus Kaiserbacteria bacterium]
MAEESGAGSGGFSFLSGDKRIPSDSFYAYLFPAVVIDGITFFFPFIPGLGTVYISYCRLMYYINGYKTNRMQTQTFIDAGIEFFPGFEAIPATSAFVIGTYMVNFAETKPVNDNKEGTGRSRTQQAASLAFSYLAARSGPAGLAAKAKEKTESGSSGAKPNQNTGYEQKGTTGNGVTAPTNAADKNVAHQDTGGNRKSANSSAQGDKSTPYQQDKNVDGISKPSERSSTKNNEYSPSRSQPISRKPQGASVQNAGYADDSEPQPVEIKNPDEQNVGYREAA